jgi:hypothetical protein
MVPPVRPPGAAGPRSAPVIARPPPRATGPALSARSAPRPRGPRVRPRRASGAISGSASAGTGRSRSRRLASAMSRLRHSCSSSARSRSACNETSLRPPCEALAVPRVSGGRLAGSTPTRALSRRHQDQWRSWSRARVGRQRAGPRLPRSAYRPASICPPSCRQSRPAAQTGPAPVVLDVQEHDDALDRLYRDVRQANRPAPPTAAWRRRVHLQGRPARRGPGPRPRFRAPRAGRGGVRRRSHVPRPRRR